MLTTINWIRKDIVILIHDKLISEFGGVFGIRDEGLLESALSNPQHLYAYETQELAKLAANYAYSLIKNHAFIDGNKRIALVVCELFLQLNGKELKSSQEVKYIMVNDLASSKIDEQDFVDWIKQNLIPHKS